jgi:hypothetical protein
MRNAIITIAAGLMLMTVTSGCASWTTSKPKNHNSMWSKMQFWKKPYQRPQKMAAIWTHDILTMTAKPPTRGFGGRIYFYNDKSQAIPVDGELIVHGYEETKVPRSDAEKTKADKTFMFTAEQFTEHFSSSELGASYSVWIPWDMADGMQKEITLIPAFKGTDGSLVQGEPAKLILPGRTIEEQPHTTPFQHVSYQQSEMPTNSGPLPVLGGMKTTTISRHSQINRIAKKSTRDASSDKSNAPDFQAKNSYTTEVQYGNNPLPQLGQQTSRALSLYPNPAQIETNGIQKASMPVQNNLPGTQSNGNTPGVGFPSTSPNTQPSQPIPVKPGFPGNQSFPPNLPVQLTPGFADFNPVQPAAVQSAFATHWQPFGQPPIPLIRQPQQNSQIQQAGFEQPTIGGQVQSQAMQPGQSTGY